MNLLADNGLGQTKFGNPVNQYSARFVKGFEDGDIVALFNKVTGNGESGWTSTNYRYFLACFRLLGGSWPVPFSRSQSETKRSRFPMATGSPRLPTMQFPSH